MTTEEKLDRLTGIVDALASSVVHHDNQIEGLIQVAEKHQKQIDSLLRSTEQSVKEMDELKKLFAATERQWQDYLTTLPRQ